MLTQLYTGYIFPFLGRSSIEAVETEQSIFYYTFFFILLYFMVYFKKNKNFLNMSLKENSPFWDSQLTVGEDLV